MNTAVRPVWGGRFWLVTVLALAGIATAVSLGRWQLARAAQKAALQAAVHAQQGQPPVTGAQLAQLGDLRALRHRPVMLRGQWRPSATVYLDNRQMNGRPGFYVLSPLQLEASAAVVLVQRGWVPRNFLDRAALPPVQTPAGWVTVQGRVADAPSRLYDFAGPEGGVIRQNLDLAGYRAETGLPLLPVLVLQTGEPSEGLLRQWPEPARGVDTHYGYAFQWFGLAGLMGVLYVWFQLVRRLHAARSA